MQTMIFFFRFIDVNLSSYYKNYYYYLYNIYKLLLFLYVLISDLYTKDIDRYKNLIMFLNLYDSLIFLK